MKAQADHLALTLAGRFSEPTAAASCCGQELALIA